MSHRLSTLLGLAALSLLGAAVGRPALAADLDYGDAPPPVAEQNVEFGSGWYVRGDISATQDYAVGVKQPPNSTLFFGSLNSTKDAAYNLSLGGGYDFTSSFRGDITADFHKPDSDTVLNTYCFNSATQTCTAVGKFKNYDALINGYYDFGKWGVVSPYVGAGVGVAFGDFSYALTGGSEVFGNSVKYHNLAWALMAGISLDVFDHTKLDVGYRYLDNGKVNGLSVHYHEIRAGLRYMIDN